MKTPEKIKKGLGCIAYGRNDIECEICWSMTCAKQTAKDAIEYIQQLEHEKETLLEDIKKTVISLCRVCKHRRWVSKKGGDLLCGKTGRSVYGVLACGMYEWRGVPKEE